MSRRPQLPFVDVHALQLLLGLLWRLVVRGGLPGRADQLEVRRCQAVCLGWQTQAVALPQLRNRPLVVLDGKLM